MRDKEHNIAEFMVTVSFFGGTKKTENCIFHVKFDRQKYNGFVII